MAITIDGQVYRNLQEQVAYLTDKFNENEGEVQAALDTKVDKVPGKGLSTNDYTTEEKNKLAGVEPDANKTEVDSTLSSTSENPVQNKVVKSAIDAKADKTSVDALQSDLVDKIGNPQTGLVGQVLAVKSVDENGKPTEFACVYQTSGGSGGSGGEVVETTFKVLPSTTTQTVGENDIVLSDELATVGFLDKNGNWVSASSYQTSEYLQINEDATIYGKYLMQYSTTLAVAFYDENKTFISGASEIADATAYTGNVAIPSGAKYVRICLKAADPNAYAQITTRETTVTDPIGTRVGFLESDVAEIKSQMEETKTLDYTALSSSEEQGYYDTNGAFQSSSSWRCTDFVPVSEGDKLDVKLTTYNTTSAIAYFDANKNFISGVVGDTWSWSTSVYPLTGEQIVPIGAYFVRVSVLVADYATEQYVTFKRNVINGIKNSIDVINGKALNVLVLGDSYSEMGKWIRFMREVIDVKNLVNLGVSSATLRDRYSDRTTYPYSDRPDKADGSGNTNTLSSQIQKLKRLMNGTDLDSGENQLYANESEYPDVIIIEGGMNDSPDSDEVVATYNNQFMTSKTAYYKANSSSSVTQTTVWVKPSLDTIDRTCFAGAYRYLCEELLALFPKAQIFITTASHMNYFTVNPNEVYGKIAEQQRKCADIMSYTVIDWHAEGNLNTMMIGLNGSGTQSDPYTPVGGDEYTTDLLHPNDEGAKRYGRLAGKVIAQRFLGFN